MKQYRRKTGGVTWHWRKDCPDFPPAPDVELSNTLPTSGKLCDICTQKDAAEEELLTQVRQRFPK